MDNNILFFNNILNNKKLKFTLKFIYITICKK